MLDVQAIDISVLSGSLSCRRRFYFRSKEVKNVFNRYQLLREMIKETSKMETNW